MLWLEIVATCFANSPQIEYICHLFDRNMINLFVNVT